VAPGDVTLTELESILTAIRHLPSRTETEPARVRERQREKGIVSRRLADLLGQSAPVRQAVDEVLCALNGHPGQPKSFDALEALLADQGYRLSHWRVAADEINHGYPVVPQDHNL
jgi:(1->4)-alpha-D-glucan 1-alpha-D-glucosylmutase